MFCKNCGKEQSEGARFCHNCGAQIDDKKSNLDIVNKNEGAPTQSVSREFFAVPVGKFILLSCLTFGLYSLFWFARNWNLIQKQEKSKIHPTARALFSIFFFYELSEKVQKSAKSNGYEKTYSSGLMTILYILFSFSYRLPENYWLVGLLIFLPFLPLLEAILYNNQKIVPTGKINSQYHTGEIITIIIGAILWALVLIGLLSNY